MPNATSISAERSAFGTMPDGTAVEAITLRNANGISARVFSYGATLQTLKLPDKSGRIDDVVLGYPHLDSYLERPQYFGSTVGRFANRIAGARFSLDGRAYLLVANDGPNSLHGGLRGFDKAIWSIEDIACGGEASVTLARTSPDGEQGFPGNLRTTVTYSLSDDDVLTTRYEAVTDKPTIVNLTHHSLFNLAGLDSLRSLSDQRLTIAADAITPVDATLIPTGEIRDVAGTPFDFRRDVEIGARIHDASDDQIAIGRGYDHNFVLNDGATKKPRFAARLHDPVTGRVLELFTTEPGLQVYSGNYLDGSVTGKRGRAYRQHDGIALEPQVFPDSPNRPEFPSARLDPGETYRQTSLIRFSLQT